MSRRDTLDGRLPCVEGVKKRIPPTTTSHRPALILSWQTARLCYVNLLKRDGRDMQGGVLWILIREGSRNEEGEERHVYIAKVSFPSRCTRIR